jgi:hypothetical protein
MRKSIHQLEIALAKLSTKYGENHRVVNKTRDEIKQAKADLKYRTDEIVSLVKKQISSKQRRKTPGSVKDYRIAAGDVVQISVFELLQEGQEAVLKRQVSGTGLISLPGMDKPVKAEGLTQDELRERIKKILLEEGILIDPYVSVMVPGRSGEVSIRRKERMETAKILKIEYDEDRYEGKSEERAENSVSLGIPLARLKAGNILLPEQVEKQMQKYGITIEGIIKMLEDGTESMELLSVEETVNEENEGVRYRVEISLI